MQQFTISNRRKLQHQLGHWIIDSDQIRAIFKYYRTQDRIYTENQLNEYPIMRESIVKSYCKQSTSSIPPYANPCFVSSSGTIYTAFKQKSVTRPIQTTLVSTERIIIVSDASLIQGRATWSFVIADLNGKMIAENTAKVQGEEILSFRAELSGVYAALQESRKTNPGALIKAFCDSKSVIARLTTIQTRNPSTMWSDYNLLQGCYKLLTKKFVFEHVRGHQDTISSNNNLT
jgi:ribonuclease HI